MIVCIYFLNNKTILFKNNYLTYKNIYYFIVDKNI